MKPLHFDNRFIRELPGDAGTSSTSQGICWSAVEPTAVSRPFLLAYSTEVLGLLNLSEVDVHSPEFLQAFAGNRLLDGMASYATRYGGHQFGQWAGQLGDGRAIGLGEVINSKGERWELQLKGAGMTPYSRRADGRAVLRSSLREFLCSEAMHHLGIPTTRALSLIATGDGVVRDMLYDGNPAVEPGAIVCRVAPSFTRFGHFEILAARGEHETLKQLVSFTIARDFAFIANPSSDKNLFTQSSSPLWQRGARGDLVFNDAQKSPSIPLSQRGRLTAEFCGDEATHFEIWFSLVCERTALLMVEWMRVGFVHGVMNTDNMSILGLTIDYGPYGWVDNFDPGWTPNTTDEQFHRYCFGQQSAVARWNVERLADALMPVAPSRKMLDAGLAHFDVTFQSALSKMLAAKFGLLEWQDDDAALVETVFDLMQQAEVDMTEFFWQLAEVKQHAPTLETLRSAFYRDALYESHAASFESWLERYVARLGQQHDDDASRRVRMNKVNPRFVLRNYLAQEAIDAAMQNDLSMIERLMQAARHPYDDDHPANLIAKRPDWALDKVGCSKLSCSS